MPRRRWLFRLAFFSARRARQEMDEEIAFHLATRAEEFARRGMSRDEAMAEAVRRFGGDPATFDAARRRLYQSAARREDRMRLHDQLEAFRQDVRYALRGIRARPGFAAAIIFTIALGVGANTTIFSVVNAVLLRPLPYDDASRVVVVWNHWPGWPRTWLSAPEVYDYAGQTEVFESFTAYTSGSVNLTGDGEPERVVGGIIDAKALPVLGVRPLLGRNMTAEEDAPNGPSVVLLSYDLWARRFGASPAVVGRQILLNGSSYLVIGVLPKAFRLPTEFTGDHAQLFLPLRLGPPNENDRGSHGFLAAARLRPGVSPTRAEARVNEFIARFHAQHPDWYGPDFGVTIVPATEEAWGQVRTLLFVLAGAVAFVLLIGCANVANLLLSRAGARQQEISIRKALGAGRARIARQLLTESLVLALAGGALGLLLALGGVRLLASAATANLPRTDGLAIDRTVLAYTLAISIATGLLFGLAPVLHAVRDDFHERLRQGRGNISAGATRVRQVLVAAEVALAVVSIVGAALMVRSFQRLLSVSPGFEPEHALTFRVAPPPTKYVTSSSVRVFYANLLGQLRALPGVRAVGAVNALPLVTTIGDWSFSIEGRPPAPQGTPGPAADWQVATDGFFEAMAIRIIRGRGFTAADRAGSAPVVVINEMAARRFWPNESALGKRIQLGGTADSLPRVVIGIATDVKHKGLDQETRTEMYLPHAQFPSTIPDSQGATPRPMTVVLRTALDPSSLTADARRIVRALDPTLPIAQVRPLDAVFAGSVSVPRLAMLLLVTFGLLSLILAAVGVYAVIAYSVSRRTNEIGIRIALGARQRDVVRLVVLQGVRPAVAGLALGILGAWAGTRLMRRLLFEVSPTDVLSFAVAALVLGAIAIAATAFPARRAAAVDPATALRME